MSAGQSRGTSFSEVSVNFGQFREFPCSSRCYCRARKLNARRETLEQQWRRYGAVGFRFFDARFDVDPMALHPTEGGLSYA